MFYDHHGVYWPLFSSAYPLYILCTGARTWSPLCLQMPWHLAVPSHQQTQLWLRELTKSSLSFHSVSCLKPSGGHQNGSNCEQETMVMMSRSIGILIKARSCLNKHAMMTLYYSFIYPYMTYCNNVWGSTYASNTEKVYNLQKRALRIMSKHHIVRREAFLIAVR